MSIWLSKFAFLAALLLAAALTVACGGDGAVPPEETATAPSPTTLAATLTPTPTPILDCDKDGLTDLEEKDLGTQPCDPDTDKDGLPDFEEVKVYETNPTDSDTDDDGLKDGEEVHSWKTDPKLYDTDGDGLTDREELQEIKTDPLVSDMDGDGLNDGQEILQRTDPRNLDSDDDGLDDGVEVKKGTDPRNPDTDGDGATDGVDEFPLFDAKLQLVVQRWEEHKCPGEGLFGIGCPGDPYFIVMIGDKEVRRSRTFQDVRRLQNVSLEPFDIPDDRNELRLTVRAFDQDGDAHDQYDISPSPEFFSLTFLYDVKAQDPRYIAGDGRVDQARRVENDASIEIDISVIGTRPLEESRKIILLQGIDSAGSCTDDFQSRQAVILDHLAQQGAWLSEDVANQSVIGFSYSDRYVDCKSGVSHTTATLPQAFLGDIAPGYIQVDTCIGVAESARRLGALIDRLVQFDPEAEFDLIAHSMGGLVAAYYLSQQTETFVRQRIHSLVLLDSPVSPGLPNQRNPFSQCAADSPSWRDLQVGSQVITSIDAYLMAKPGIELIAVVATPIGQRPSEAKLVVAAAYTSGAAGLVGGVLVSAVACLALPVIGCPAAFAAPFVSQGLEVSSAHSAIWNDATALRAIVEAVLALEETVP